MAAGRHRDRSRRRGDVEGPSSARPRAVKTAAAGRQRQGVPGGDRYRGDGGARHGRPGCARHPRHIVLLVNITIYYDSPGRRGRGAETKKSSRHNIRRLSTNLCGV